MEKQLKCGLLLSLEEMAFRRVAVVLWSDSEILSSISEFQMPLLNTEKSKKERREIIENKIKEKVAKLELPTQLAKQMIDKVRPIYFEIGKWKRFHQNLFYDSHEDFSLPDLTKLRWTTGGTIDYRKTAEDLLRCGWLEVDRRYKLACFYCLEDHIPLLREELPEEDTQRDLLYPREANSPDQRFCCLYALKREPSKLDELLRTMDLTSFNQYAFEFSIKDGNKSAAEYFFEKLTDEEKEASLMRTAHAVMMSTKIKAYLEELFSDLLCYLMSLMTSEQQMEMVKLRPVDVFICFFRLSWRDLYLENAAFVWNFVPPSGYGKLLKNVEKILNTDFDFYYPKLFQEFFIQSPAEFKKYFVDPRPESCLINAHVSLACCFRLEDSEAIEAIFKNLDSADRVKLLFDYDFLGLLFIDVLKGRWFVVEACLRETNLPKEGRECLKKAFSYFLERKDAGEIELGNPNWKRFFEFVDQTHASSDKEKKV